MAKLRSRSAPRGVWTTSGWNWTPKMRRARSCTAAKGALAVEATGSKPGGSASTRSPWLIQTSSRAGSPWKSAQSPLASMVAGPYSRCAARSTLPPSSWAMSCRP